MALELFKQLPNFKLHEFHCKDGTPVPVEFHDNVVRLAKDLQVLRDELKKPVVITSAYRTKEHNKIVSGAVNSYHLRGKAVDFKVKGYSIYYVALVLHRLMLEGRISIGGIGVYDSFIHYDHRGYYSLFRL